MHRLSLASHVMQAAVAVSLAMALVGKRYAENKRICAWKGSHPPTSLRAEHRLLDTVMRAGVEHSPIQCQAQPLAASGFADRPFTWREGDKGL